MSNCCKCCCKCNTPRYHGKWWNTSERSSLRRMYLQGFSSATMARRLGRSRMSIEMKREQLGLF